MAHLLYQTEASKIAPRTPLYYAERADYRERWTPGSNEASRTVVVPWSQRHQLVQDFVGVVSVNGTQLDRKPLELHPEYNWMPCVSMDLVTPQGVAFFDDDAKLGKPWIKFFFTGGSEGYAVYRANHANVQYRIVGNNAIGTPAREYRRWTYLRETYQTEAQQVPGGSWQIVGTDVIIPEATSIPYHTKEVRITWFQTPVWSRDNIEAVLNKVNNAAWPGITQNNVTYDYAPHTLLFAGLEYEEKRSSAGQLLWDVTFIAKWRQSTWNQFFYIAGPSGPGYYPVVNPDTGNPPFGSADFNQLFAFGA